MPASAAGARLDAWLAELPAVRSRARAQRLLDAGQVRVDGTKRAKSHRLEGGERVELDPELERERLAPAAAAPRIAWEDDDLLIVDKPAGLVVHPAAGHRRVTLVELLRAEAGGRWEPFVVHRLDRDTSGLMLVAKDELTQERLRAQIRRREVEREYLALVAGRVAARTGTIDAPIGRDVRRRTRMSTRTDKPRAARTHFTVERYAGRYTLVRARLETGRTHQIRAHFAAIRHPVAGDREYGGPALAGLGRQFLHSARIAFPHPGGGGRVEEASPLPADLAEALARVEGE